MRNLNSILWSSTCWSSRYRSWPKFNIRRRKSSLHRRFSNRIRFYLWNSTSFQNLSRINDFSRTLLAIIHNFNSSTRINCCNRLSLRFVFTLLFKNDLWNYSLRPRAVKSLVFCRRVGSRSKHFTSLFEGLFYF
jgi:hypothetical protein